MNANTAMRTGAGIRELGTFERGRREHFQVADIDAYGFPEELNGHPLLAWMGNDYVQYIAEELLQQFREQDAGTQMLAIKCEEQPRILTSLNERTNRVRGVVAKFNLQVLLKASNGQHWRLRGDGTFRAAGLDEPELPSTKVQFELRSTEEAM
jgi:hypothetical protein